MYQYRVFVKDCLDLKGVAIANEICTSFSFKKDLLTSSTGSFNLLNDLEGINNGDILGLLDPYGTILYEGVITSIGEKSIQTKELLSIFNDNWLWYDPPYETIEEKIKDIIETDFINSSDTLLSKKYPFDIVIQSNTIGTLEEQSEDTVKNLESILNELYNTYGIICDIEIPYISGTPKITLKQANNTPYVIGDNVKAIRNLTPLTEVVETNKLVIYTKTEEKDEEIIPRELRGVYYATTEGITTNSDDENRLPVIKTKFVFENEKELEEIVQENLQEEMYNHKITFDLILENKIYDFFDWELGQELYIWYGNTKFSTIFTGYSISKNEVEQVYQVSITCGKVRNNLTEIINGY